MIKVREQDKEFASKVLEKARRKEQRKQQLAEQEREVRMFVTNNYYILYMGKYVDTRYIYCRLFKNTWHCMHQPIDETSHPPAFLFCIITPFSSFAFSSFPVLLPFLSFG